MARIKAIDGATVRVNGIPFPIPVGTEINMRKGNDDNTSATGTEMNGDGSMTTIFSRITSSFEGMVFSITDTATEEEFNNLFSTDGHQVVLENGGQTYTMASAAFISPSEDGVPAVVTSTRKTEAFNIVSLQGKIQ